MKTALDEAGEDVRHYHDLWKAAERREAALKDLLRDEYEWHRAIADDEPCDAGNWDGGNAADCAHCQHSRAAERLRAALGGDDA
jgi:hypothetical protein